MPYFTVDEFRAAMPDMDNEPKYPEAQVEAKRDAVEALIEGRAGTSFIARTVTETVDGSGTYGLVLRSPYIQSITSVTENGTTVSGYDFTIADGVLERCYDGAYTPVVWTAGRRNISVVYEAGYSATPPDDLKRAAMRATRAFLLADISNTEGLSERALQLTTEYGSVNLSSATEDKPTGLPEVDATIMSWVNTVRVPSVG
jgi:hypothetical protein